MKKKKVMIFLPYMPGYGGIETVVKNLLEEYDHYQGNDCELRVVCIGGYGDGNWISNIKDKTVIQLSQNKNIRTVEYATIFPGVLLYEVLKYKPDVVVSTSSKLWSTLYFWRNLFHLKYKVASWRHSSLLYYPSSDLALRMADIFLSISTGIGKQLQEKGVSKDKIRVIYNPVKEGKYSIPRTSKSDPVKFVFVGRLMLGGQKNMKEMLDGFSQVHGNWSLDIYGKGTTEQKLELQNYINKLGIQDHINFAGFKKDLWGTVGSADAVIMTSVFEGLPMALLEAVSNGVPVISSDCATGPNDIVNSSNGYLYQPGNIKELGEILQNFIDRKDTFEDVNSVKHSIDKFYSENYFSEFLKSLY